MSSNLARSSQTLSSSLTIMSGKDKGVEYQLRDSSISLGRDPKNDIVITDEKVSREHALIKIHSQGIIVKNINPKNYLIFKGAKVQEIIIADSADFKIGNIKVRVKASHALPETTPLKSLNNKSSKHPKRTSTPDNKRRNFYIIVGVILVAGAYLVMSKNEKKDDDLKLKLNNDVTHQLEEKQLNLQSIEDEMMKGQLQTKTNKKSKAFYIKGFRDYQQGQYQRAVSSFQACLSIEPNSLLCGKYLQLSKKKTDEIVQYHMRIGRQSLEQKQYRNCISSFKNVMYTIKNKTDATYQEALLNFKMCRMRSKERF